FTHQAPGILLPLVTVMNRVCRRQKGQRFSSPYQTRIKQKLLNLAATWHAECNNSGMQQRRFWTVWGLGFLFFIAPTVLGAQSPEVLALIQQAIDSDREIARLLLEEESAAIQDEQADLSSHKAVSISASP